MLRFVHTKDTRNEMNFTFKNKESTDVVFTHIKGKVNIYNAKEFYPQLAVFKNNKYVSRYSNIRKITINDEECYLFIVQDEDTDNDPPICSLAAAHGLMVSGIGYITTDKNLLRVIQRSIGIDTMHGKGKEFCE